MHACKNWNCHLAKLQLPQQSSLLTIAPIETDLESGDEIESDGIVIVLFNRLLSLRNDLPSFTSSISWSVWMDGTKAEVGTIAVLGNISSFSSFYSCLQTY